MRTGNRAVGALTAWINVKIRSLLQRVIDGSILMNPKLMVAAFVIAAAPVCVQAQDPTPVTKADAQKILKIISGDKTKTRAYCEMAKLVDQLEQANESRDSEKFDGLSRTIDQLAKKLGPEYAALMERLPDIDAGSEDGKEIASTLDELDKLCEG